MRILIMGAGKMGRFFAHVLHQEHDIAVYDNEPLRLESMRCGRILMRKSEIASFNSQLVINAVTLQRTLSAFKEILPLLSKDCILSDICSVKTGLRVFYEGSGHPYVSVHPMFGPTFANLNCLANEYSILINEGDVTGRQFYREVFERLELHLRECTFDEHDRIMATSLSVPFAVSMAFASSINRLQVPGTTFKKYVQIARGVLGEDTTLLSEILFNTYSSEQIGHLREELKRLIAIIEKHDSMEMGEYITGLRHEIDALEAV